MEDKMLECAYNLKKAIEEDERVIDLKQREKEMEESEEVMRLSYLFSVAQDNYNDVLKYFPSDSEAAKEKQKMLYEKKKELDSHPLVQNYLKSYQKVRMMYDEIQKTLFEPFNTHKCE